MTQEEYDAMNRLADAQVKAIARHRDLDTVLNKRFYRKGFEAGFRSALSYLDGRPLEAERRRDAE